MFAALTQSVPVTSDSLQQWAPFLKAFAARRLSPRYYLSSADAAANKAAYRWLILQDCLLVVKWVTMGGIKIHLALPPINLHGEIGTEVGILREMQEAGIGARLSAEDLDLYAAVDATPDPHGPEFLYAPQDYANLDGRVWKAWRAASNQFRSRQWSVDTSATLQDLLGVSSDWARERAKNANHESRIAKAIH